MPASSSSILITAGDISGDVHSAALARALLARDPGIAIHSLGGARLSAVARESVGGHVIGDTTNCSAIGLVSAIKIYLRCWKLRAQMRRFLDSHHVDAVVLCDWGAFNGRILPELHARGLPILYYFPPRSWQRSGNSGLGIVPHVRRVATPFEWSAEKLRAAGCDAEWVGHPSLEKVSGPEERAALRKSFGIEPDEKLVALMPGSRRSEIEILAPKLAETAHLINARQQARFIAVLPHELAHEARSRLPSSIPIVTDCALDLLRAADAAIVKLGTASLEAVLADVPQVTVYDFSILGRIEWVLLWSWKRIRFFAMPNIILQRPAIPELLGRHSQPKQIADHILRLLEDGAERRQMLADYDLIRRALGSELPERATERTAQIVEEMLRETTASRPVAAAAA